MISVERSARRKNKGKMMIETKLQAAWHLSVGSRETAQDLQKIIAKHHPIWASEISLLAENLERIGELLKEAGVKP